MCVNWQQIASGVGIVRIVTAALIFSLAHSRSMAEPAAKPRLPSRRATGPKITISKQTTYLTGPIGASGHVDYVTAINERAREGVTAKNNAVVALAQAFGNRMTMEGAADQFFGMLGVRDPGPAAAYVDVPDFIGKLTEEIDDREERGRAAAKLDEQFRAAQRLPWTEQEFPEVAQWLRANDVAISHMHSASRRSKFYAPVLFGGSLLLSFEPRGTTEVTKSAAILRTRAMLCIGRGDMEAAWRDLLAAHRLCRLCTRGADWIQVRSGPLATAQTCEADVGLATCGRLSSDRLRKMRDDLAQLCEPPPLAERYGDFVRLGFLSRLTDLALDGPFGFIRDAEDPPAAREAWLSVAADIDWDEMMREGNRWFDRGTSIFQGPYSAEQKSELIRWRDDFEKMVPDWEITKESPENVRRRILEAAPAERTQMLRAIAWRLVPQVPYVVPGAASDRMRTTLTDLAFAMSMFRADHGGYPERLAELVPDYLSESPRDLFCGGELRYSRRGGGFLLYSVGVNGMDDGGRTSISNPPGDDLVVSAP